MPERSYETLYVSIPSKHNAISPFAPSPSLRASSYKSSDGSIRLLRRNSSVTSLIPETDAFLDKSVPNDTFKVAILKILIKLKLCPWKLSEADNLVIKNIASALTNSVYLIILDSQKLLLRIYGPNVLHLIDRDYETSVLARLAHHKIGPRLLGQFKNGRIEQWLESVEVTSAEVRVPVTSRYIARRMREFHDYMTLLPQEQGKVSAAVNLDCWIPALPQERLTPTLKQFLKHIDQYRALVKGREGEYVFCHNDLQYGNLLRTKGEEHHCLAVIDFEYAGPNPRAYDIANHFNEWMANYHESPAHVMDPLSYPTYEEAQIFFEEYIYYGKVIARREDPVVTEEEIQELRDAVDLWRCMSHAQWAIWGVVQALPADQSTNLTAEEERVVDAIDKHQLKHRTSFSSIRARRGSKSAQSPLVHGMRAPFLSATIERIPFNKRSGSYKSPGYFPSVEPALTEEEEEDDFTLGESALAALSQSHVHHHNQTQGHPTTDDELLFGGDSESSEAWVDEEQNAFFDYIAYSKERIGFFYGEIIRLGLIKPEEVPEGVVIKQLPESCLLPTTQK